MGTSSPAFASEGLEHLLATHGLPTIPLVPDSSSQAIVGAIVGLGLMRGGRDVDWRLVRHWRNEHERPTRASSA